MELIQSNTFEIKITPNTNTANESTNNANIGNTNTLTTGEMEGSEGSESEPTGSFRQNADEERFWRVFPVTSRDGAILQLTLIILVLIIGLIGFPICIFEIVLAICKA
ncbi:hypothetical protein I9W82_004615 [Candida metapsilosis]|uniref:Uncharacterized protein n=1 Tax=Candida metapsilosis TaxID=273372 RepID=A0A8H7ZB26_9ASCO|nr:hypothetical protein I9W82_004615 [Candida metapsilosis]